MYTSTSLAGADVGFHIIREPRKHVVEGTKQLFMPALDLLNVVSWARPASDRHEMMAELAGTGGG